MNFVESWFEPINLEQIKADMDRMERELLQIPEDHPVPELVAYRTTGLAQVAAGRKWQQSLLFDTPELTARLAAETLQAAETTEAAGRALDAWMAEQEAQP